jgi:D-alanyl-D-alanine dipeptidase
MQYSTMKKLFTGLFFIISAAANAQSALDEIVPVKELIPDIWFDIRYSTESNFSNQKLYTVGEAYLSIGAINKLKLVHDSLKNIKQHNGMNYPKGLGIKIYDAYRPRAVQYLMFEIIPDPTYVADPIKGSIHNRGGAVDVSIVNMENGIEIPMPTKFDWFGLEASHSYSNLSDEVISNRRLLVDIMVNVGGFIPYESEWWHYSIPGASALPLLDFQLK